MPDRRPRPREARAALGGAGVVDGRPQRRVLSADHGSGGKCPRGYGPPRRRAGLYAVREADETVCPSAQCALGANPAAPGHRALGRSLEPAQDRLAYPTARATRHARIAAHRRNERLRFAALALPEPAAARRAWP